MIAIDARPFLTIPFRRHGRDRRGADCWGLYRLVVEAVTGIRLDEHGDTPTRGAEARRIADQGRGGDWREVAPGDERPTDLVLMTGYVRDDGGRLHAAPLHVGCVIAPGLMIDTDEGPGVRIRRHRSSRLETADPDLVRRVISLHRHRALAAWLAAEEAA